VPDANEPKPDTQKPDSQKPDADTAGRGRRPMAGWRAGLTTQIKSAERRPGDGWTGWFPEWNAAAKPRGPRKASAGAAAAEPPRDKGAPIARFAIKA
jgi:hypothetical protein